MIIKKDFYIKEYWKVRKELHSSKETSYTPEAIEIKLLL